MHRFPLLAIALLLPACLLSAPAQAQTTNAVSYPASWNMVGGPAGSDFSAAQTLYLYDSTGYVVPSSRIAELCQGYWAYFAQPVTIPLAVASPSTTQSCPLQAGWTMIGNPFTTVAMMPLGTTAYLWNTVTDRYDAVTSIPVGAAVWIYAPSAMSVSLQAATGTHSGTVVITPPFSPPYQVHVGDIVELLLPGTMGTTAHADPTYLQLIDSGSTLSYPTAQFWRWRAVTAGMTFISADPACRQTKPPCEIPSIGVEVTILP